MTRKQGRITEFFIAVTTAALIVMTGKLLADSFNRFRLTQQNAIINNLFLEENTITRELLTSDRIYAAGWQYSKSLATAAASLEFVPGDSVRLFADIMESLPDDVELTNFNFVGEDLHIRCTATSLEAGNLFADQLRKSPRVGGLILDYYENDEGLLVYELICIHHRQEGQSVILDILKD